jgi:hypothetical protein
VPGNLAKTSASAVLPQSLSRAFVHTCEHPAIANECPNGESMRPVLASIIRKRWRMN